MTARWTDQMFVKFLTNKEEKLLQYSNDETTSPAFSIDPSILSFLHSKLCSSISDRILHSDLSNEELKHQLDECIVEMLADHWETEHPKELREGILDQLAAQMRSLHMLSAPYGCVREVEQKGALTQTELSLHQTKKKDSPKSAPTAPPSVPSSPPLPPPIVSSLSSPSSYRLLQCLSSESEEISPIHPSDLRLMVRNQFNDVNIRDVTMKIDGRELLTLSTLFIKKNHHYGLVSRNGLGKSTLLRRIATHRIEGFPETLIVSLMKQEESIEESRKKTSIQVVIEGDKERTLLLERERTLKKQLDEFDPISSKDDNVSFHSLQSSLQEVIDRLHFIEADTIEKRAQSLLEKMNIDKALWNKPMEELSGGIRMRVRLCAALLLDPHWLLLDEPTNHQDAEAIRFLIQFLRSHRSTFTSIIVSHDRFFLNAVTTDIIYLHNNQLAYYPCNYEGFIEAKLEKRKKEERLQAALDSKRDHIKASMEKIKKQAREKGHGEMNLGIIASRKKKLGRMGMEKTADGKKFNAQLHGRRAGAQWNTAGGYIDGAEADCQVDYDEKELEIVFCACRLNEINGHIDPQLISLQAVTVQFPSQSLPLFSSLNFSVSVGRKIGIVGRNSIGKSIFLRLLYNDPSLSPFVTEGSIHWKKNVRCGYFHQHQIDSMPLQMTPVEFYKSVYPDSAEGEARRSLSRMGIKKELVGKPIGLMSGGEKSRVGLAVVSSPTLSPHVLMLDEVSNNLDEPSIRHLIVAIREFQGTVIVVSHDQSLVDECCDELWVVEAAEKRTSKAKGGGKKKGKATDKEEDDEDDIGPRSLSQIRRLPTSYSEYLNSVYGRVDDDDDEEDLDDEDQL